MNVTSEHIMRAVGRHLNWRQGILVPEAVVTYKTGEKSTWGEYDIQADYLADLMWVTGSNYATEIEIKVSRSDWKADLAKGKWRGMPPWVSRFIYAVPKELGIPDFVPEIAGVWHFSPSRYRYQHITVARAPRRIGKEKVPQVLIDRWLRHLYGRFWHQRLYLDDRLPKLAEVEVA